jgi:malate dehydrogenase (oxaloacetate-decarboxylating)(NADP+)
LVEELNIPVMHDEHGTAIISSAALLNALELAKKLNIQNSGFRSRIGSTSMCKLVCIARYQPDNIIMFDKDGVISSERNDLSALQKNIQKENQELP